MSDRAKICRVEVTETELAVLDMVRRHADFVQLAALKVPAGTWVVALVLDGYYTPAIMARDQAEWAAEWSGIRLGPVYAEIAERGRLVGTRHVDPTMVADPELAAALRAAESPEGTR